MNIIKNPITIMKNKEQQNLEAYVKRVASHSYLSQMELAKNGQEKVLLTLLNLCKSKENPQSAITLSRTTQEIIAERGNKKVRLCLIQKLQEDLLPEAQGILATYGSDEVRISLINTLGTNLHRSVQEYLAENTCEETQKQLIASLKGCLHPIAQCLLAKLGSEEIQKLLISTCGKELNWYAVNILANQAYSDDVRIKLIPLVKGYQDFARTSDAEQSLAYYGSNEVYLALIKAFGKELDGLAQKRIARFGSNEVRVKLIEHTKETLSFEAWEICVRYGSPEVHQALYTHSLMSREEIERHYQKYKPTAQELQEFERDAKAELECAKAQIDLAHTIAEQCRKNCTYSQKERHGALPCHFLH